MPAIPRTSDIARALAAQGVKVEYIDATTHAEHRMTSGYNVTCSKCGKSFSSAADFLTQRHERVERER